MPAEATLITLTEGNIDECLNDRDYPWLLVYLWDNQWLESHQRHHLWTLKALTSVAPKFAKHGARVGALNVNDNKNDKCFWLAHVARKHESSRPVIALIWQFTLKRREEIMFAESYYLLENFLP